MIIVPVTCTSGVHGCKGYVRATFPAGGPAAVRSGTLVLALGRSTNVFLIASHSERHRIRFTERLPVRFTMAVVGQPLQSKSGVLRGLRPRGR